MTANSKPLLQLKDIDMKTTSLIKGGITLLRFFHNIEFGEKDSWNEDKKEVYLSVDGKQLESKLCECLCPDVESRLLLRAYKHGHTYKPSDFMDMWFKLNSIEKYYGWMDGYCIQITNHETGYEFIHRSDNMSLDELFKALVKFAEIQLKVHKEDRI